MAVPKSRKSKAKKRMRRSQWKLSATSLCECPQCHGMKLPHRVCKSCGYYNGKAVVKVSNE